MKSQVLLNTATIGGVILEAMTTFAALGLLTALLTGGRFKGPGILTTIVIALAAFAISRVTQHLTIDETVLRRWAVGVSVAVFYLVARAEFAGDLAFWDLSWLGALLGGISRSIAGRPDIFIGVPGLLVLWARGVIIGQMTVNFESFLFPFSFALVVTAITATFADAAGAREALKVLPVFATALGLTVLALAHVSRVESGPGQGFGRSWGLVLLVTLVLLLGFTTLFATLDLGGVRALLVPVGDAALWLLNGIFLILTFLIVYPIYLLLRAIVYAVGLIVSSEALDRLAQMLDEREAMRGEAPPPGLPGIFLIIERIIALVVIAAAIGFALYWLYRRYMQLRRIGGGERESVFNRGSLGEDLNAIMSGLLGRFQRKRPPRPAIDGGLDSIRRLYLRVLDRAREGGLTRPPAATPNEFAPPLVEHFRSETPEEITGAFGAARYGRRYPSRADVDRLAAKWRAIREEKE
jgi:hypothetical protein